MIMKKHLLFWFFFTLCYFPLFLHLDVSSLRLWDESRQAVNALEMALNGNILVTYFDGKPDLWNTKPPLLIWIQAFCMKVLGYNELSVRLPSALAGLATVVLLFFYSQKILKNTRLAYIVGLLLITTEGYINTHGTRTGDYDALLTLFENFYLLAFLAHLFADDIQQRKWYLYAATFGVALAFMTKGIAGFFFLPALLIFTWWKGQLQGLFSMKLFYLSTFGITILVIGYYGLREYLTPGYLAAVQNYELGGRFLEVQDEHFRPWHYYWSDLYQKERLGQWLFFIPLGTVLGFLQKRKMRETVGLIVLNVLFVIGLLSFSASKLRWYLVPLYPTLILLAAIGIDELISSLKVFLKQKGMARNWINIIVGICLIALIFPAYKKTIQRIYWPTDNEWVAQFTSYRDFMRQTKIYTDYTILHSNYNGQIIFYKNLYNRTKKGYHIQSTALHVPTAKKTFENEDLVFDKGELLMVCEKKIEKVLKENYEYEVLERGRVCKLLKIRWSKNVSNK